jgi:hypothetical protein
VGDEIRAPATLVDAALSRDCGRGFDSHRLHFPDVGKERSGNGTKVPVRAAQSASTGRVVRGRIVHSNAEEPARGRGALALPTEPAFLDGVPLFMKFVLAGSGLTTTLAC